MTPHHPNQPRVGVGVPKNVTRLIPLAGFKPVDGSGTREQVYQTSTLSGRNPPRKRAQEEISSVGLCQHPAWLLFEPLTERGERFFLRIFQSIFFLVHPHRPGDRSCYLAVEEAESPHHF